MRAARSQDASGGAQGEFCSQGRLWLFAKNTQTAFPLGVPKRGIASDEVKLGFYCNSSAVSSLIRDHEAFPEGSRIDGFHRLSREIPLQMDWRLFLVPGQLAFRADGCRCASYSRGGSRVRVPRGNS